jgi:hypothetical protein
MPFPYRLATFVLLPLSMLAFSGCRVTRVLGHPVALADAQDLYRATAPKNLEVEIRYASPSPSTPVRQTRRGRIRLVDANALVLTESPNNLAVVPFRDIRSVRYDNRTKGVWYGLLAGGLLGLTAGTVEALSFCRPEKPCANDVLLAGALGTVVFGFIGLAIGAATGHRTTVAVSPDDAR